jgi:polysaccharide deacetylase family sporulation protein PdaB
LIVAGCGKHPSSTTVSASQEKPPVDAAAASQPIVPLNNQLSKVFFHASTKEKEVALTFDDGPDDKYTPRVLDILKNYHIHATFFLVGEHAEKYPQMVKRIAQEGHEIGNHTWDHSDLTKLSKEQITQEVTKTDDVINKAADITPKLFRAPYGAVNKDVLAISETSGHQTIGWSVDTLDWDGKTVSEILHNVDKETGPGGIILMHSAGGKGGHLEHTVEALPTLIHNLEQKGYRFVQVSDLLGH